MVEPNEHDVFELRQRIKLVINQYEFTLPGGEPVCFVEQKRFAFKEDIRFYTDDSKSVELMRLKARQRFDPSARYDVTDASGAAIGQIQKVFGASLLRSTYKLFDAGGSETATVQEKSVGVALFRRFVGFIPFIGGFADWLPIPYHFDFVRGGQVLGTHTRQTLKFRDTYTIDFSADPGRTLDRRLVLATAVGLDALQAR
ncbi:hypothetical protein DVA67_017425 [Solirubrobacter sp. CPCC 204708]|uniref:Scramblase n=1 Tax=Solirubrobacter deserti TaxID=2282478 RepID=A0ABT4RD66_9ACTN|nr:hypothetical protein [Solirubrobacter deserti]MBE2317767.1 hypothetical protein [Solirubrobacter deserti]MDA0136456.1 hypothetical protein [Solirubrobacter deserti]